MTRHYTSREFNHDLAGAKRASKSEPVVITDRGKPSHVLLSWDDYQRLGDRRPRLTDLLSFKEVAELDFDLPPRGPGPASAPADE